MYIVVPVSIVPPTLHMHIIILTITLLLIFVQLLGANHPDVAKQFINLAILCTHLGRYDEVGWL